MSKLSLVWALVLCPAYFMIMSSAHARTIYLNGIDISSARNQTLKGINLRIDENGNLFIEAPHYQVNEEQDFTPLSSYLHNVNKPTHTERGALPPSNSAVGATTQVPDLNHDSPMSQPVTDPASEDQPVENTPPKLQDKPGESTGGVE